MAGDLRPYVSALHRSFLEQGAASHAEVHGSLVFADVSGFTALAERLARRGKVGAEELTNTLNTVFGELLGVAGRWGGDCLKFGGDAVLLLFTGDRHASRAARAAHDMQAALRALRRTRSGAGLAKLAMSVGVHSGSLHAFLVGSSHRELMLAGPGVSAVLGLESAAQGGQILVSEATAADLTIADVQGSDAGLLLRRAPSTAEATLPSPLLDGDAVSGIPDRVRGHLDGLRKEGEHRLAVIGFLKFGGTERLLDEGGGPALLDALEELVELVQERCREHEVTFLATDVDADGGKIILATGIPSASAEDEDRLLLALREVLDAASGIPLHLRAGVNRGRIFAVDLGGADRRTFTVMGDAVNLAARVMGHARWGQLIATQDVLDRTRTHFELEHLAPFLVKGKADPVTAAVVGAPVGRREVGATPGAVLIGRQEQQALIRAAFDDAHRGVGQIIEIVGEPGIGKSSLVAAVTQTDHGLSRFTFEAGRYSLATPYFALRRGLLTAMGLAPDAGVADVAEVLQGIVADTAPHLVPWMPLLGVPVGLELPDTPETGRLDPANRQAQLHRSVVELMEHLLADPTLITIEDAHWLDTASCELLRALLSGVTSRPWAVVITRRAVPGGLELADLPASSLLLGHLSNEELKALAASAAGGAALPPGVIDDLVERSGGNPLFLRELVRASLTGGVGELPESIEAVVGTTIDALPPADRTLLRHAAVLGGHFPVDVLAAMVDAPLPNVTTEMRRLDHYLTLDERSGVAGFRHILLRDVAYETLPYRARQRLHERAGSILEEQAADPDALAELLAIHFHRAGRFASSWRYSLVAGDRARRTGAPVEAATFYGAALDAARRLADVSPVERAEIAERLGDTWELGGRYDRATAAYAQARRLAGDDPLRFARLCRKAGWVRDHEGRYAEAKRWFGKGLRALDQVDPTPAAGALRAQLLTASVSADLRQGRHRRAVATMEAAVQEAATSGDRAALAYSYYVLDQVLVEHGRLDEARHSELAVPIYEELGDERGAAAAHNELGNIAYWQGRWDDAVGAYELAVEADRRAGALVNNAIYLNNIAEIRSDQGRLDEAESLLTAAHELWAGGGWRIGEGWAMSNLGRVASRAGRQDDAEERFRLAMKLLGDVGAEGMLLETEARELERLVFAAASGRVLDTVGALLDQARARAAGHVVQLLERVEGYAWAQVGEPERGLTLLEASIARSRARRLEYETALTLDAAACVGRALACPELDAWHGEAEATFARLGVVGRPEVPLPPSMADRGSGAR